EGAITWYGRLSPDDIPGFLSEIDIGFSGQRKTSVLTMHHSPLKLYEYAAAGIPMIASHFADANIIAESVGASWMLFDPENVGSLISSISQANDHRGQWGDLGSLLRSRAMENWSWVARQRQFLLWMNSGGIFPLGGI